MNTTINYFFKHTNMKTNTKMNNVIEFFSTNLSKLNGLISEVSSSKLTSSFCKTSLLLLFVFNVTNLKAQTSSCKAILKVNLDRNNRSTPPEGTFYAMVISNTGNGADTYVLSSSNANKNSINPDGSSVTLNVTLTVEFLDKNQKPISEIKVNPDETISFFAHILVPRGTTINKWATTQVIAKSKICSNYKVDTVLHTLVIDPKEDN